MNFLYIICKGAFDDLPDTLIQLGHQLTVFQEKGFDPNNMAEQRYHLIDEELSIHTYDYVISYLFLPEVSNICQSHKVHYISWTYDSPLAAFYHEALFNDYNLTFVFDRSEADLLRRLGAPHIFHLPMAVNTARTNRVPVSEDDKRRFSSDISFLGGLYENNTYNEIVSALPENFQLELKTYLMRNLCNWSEAKPWPTLSDELTHYLLEATHITSWSDFDIPANLFYGFLVLARKLAEMDRLTVLNVLAESHKVDLYTYSQSPYLNNVCVHPPVAYNTDMNKVFSLSRINLNITLPSIVTGVPQRIYDIVGSGGFLLTNYQEELDSQFVIGHEIEVFHDLDELKEKSDYYLSHEEARSAIAAAGYRRVCKDHTYLKRITQMLDIVREATK